MKKILFVLIACSVLFSSCMNTEGLSLVKKDESVIAEETLKTLISHIQSKDEEELKNMFTKKTQKEVEDFEQSVLDLIDFYEGELTFVHTDPVATDMQNDSGYKEKNLVCVYTIKTTKQSYHIVLKECITNTYDNRLGIVSFSIINVDDWDSDYTYRGDGKYTPGIHIDREKIEAPLF